MPFSGTSGKEQLCFLSKDSLQANSIFASHLSNNCVYYLEVGQLE